MDLELNLSTESVALAHPESALVVDPQTPVRAVFHLLRQLRRGCALICREGQLIGLFTERDALRIMADNGPWEAPIEQVMARQPVVASPCDSVALAIRKLSFSGHRRLPIVDGAGLPVGVIKVSRIVHYLVEHFSHSVYTLPPQPQVLTHEREGA